MKKLTLTLCFLAILGSAASAYFYMQVGDTKQVLTEQLDAKTTQAASLEADLATSKEQAAGLQQRLAALDSELGDTKSRLSSSDARSVQISRDLTQVRSQLTAKEEAEKEAQAQIGQLRAELVKARLDTGGSSSDEADTLKQTIAALEARIQEMSTQSSGSGMVATTTASPSAAASATSETAVAPSVPLSNLPAGFTTKVASVGPHNSFVVLSFGKTEGAQAGQTLVIVRDGQEIARAQISEVRDGYAIAQVSPNSIKSALRAGDEAASSAPRS